MALCDHLSRADTHERLEIPAKKRRREKNRVAEKGGPAMRKAQSERRASDCALRHPRHGLLPVTVWLNRGDRIVIQLVFRRNVWVR